MSTWVEGAGGIGPWYSPSQEVVHTTDNEESVQDVSDGNF